VRFLSNKVIYAGLNDDGKDPCVKERLAISVKIGQVLTNNFGNDLKTKDGITSVREDFINGIRFSCMVRL